MRKNLIKLEAYEEICPECKGYGKAIVGANWNGGSHTEVSGYCSLCEGEGTIDWIDKIKRAIHEIDYSRSWMNRRIKMCIIEG